MQIEEVTLITLIADDGKTFMRKSDNEILGNKITLGINDDTDNYIEIDDTSEE